MVWAYGLTMLALVIIADIGAAGDTQVVERIKFARVQQAFWMAKDRKAHLQTLAAVQGIASDDKSSMPVEFRGEVLADIMSTSFRGVRDDRSRVYGRFLEDQINTLSLLQKGNLADFQRFVEYFRSLAGIEKCMSRIHSATRSAVCHDMLSLSPRAQTSEEAKVETKSP